MGITDTVENEGSSIKYIKQNIANVTRGVIAHGCNYVGVMGAGVARVLADKYPQCFTEYAKWLQRYPDRSEALGECLTVKINDDLYIADCITQGLEMFDGRLATPEAIKASLNLAYLDASQLRLPLYLPKIGAGLGGLNWEKDVEPIVNELASHFDEVDTYVCVYP